MNTDKLKANEIIKLIQTKKSDYWDKIREESTLRLFHQAADNVPAYQHFLSKNQINPKKIKSWEEFQSVPSIDKNNYLREYPLEKLCWNGNLNKPFVYTATSGSTGEPFYFMREEKIDWQCSVIKEMFLRMNPKKVNKTTLVIDCFGMGIWIGGLITYRAYELASIRNNYPVSIITPGINKREIFNALKNLAPQYEQTIIAGYPPFIKDVIDESPAQGIDLKKLKIRIQFAAEAISEKFRDYIARKSGMDNLYLDSMSIYGSADIGAMGFESTTSILVRRLAEQNKHLLDDIFSPINNKTPTLSQFIPFFINFEKIGNGIVLSGNSAMPLIKYKIGDNGGVLSFNEVNAKLRKYGKDLYFEAKKRGIEEAITELPFVYIYERADLSTTFYGISICPEWLKDALLNDIVSKYLTGKFTLRTKYDNRQNQILEINLEQKKEVKIDNSFKKTVMQKIVTALRTKSSEYRELSDKLKQKSSPRLNFLGQGNTTYFPSGVKQRWVTKN